MKTSKQTIHKGMHRPCKTPAALDFCGFVKCAKNGIISRTFDVTFDKNCLYTIAADKQLDWNKLFGFCFGIGGIHKNSFRFGWRYNPNADYFNGEGDEFEIELSRLEYLNGAVTREKIAKVLSGNTYTLTIEYNVNTHKVLYYLDGACIHCSQITRMRGMYFGCGLYFGGSSVAPHNITVTYANY